MAIRIGYACINTTLPSPNRTTRLRSAEPEKLLELSRLNLAALETILRWNEAHDVRLFRISSDTIPFGSHPVNTLPWWELLAPELGRIGALVRAAGMRVSMHPGQYTVLSSPRPEVVDAGLADIEYHTRLLDALGVGAECKIVVHLGGVYGDKPAAMRRFAANYRRLSASARRRLVIENDERSYTLADALAMHAEIGAPVVFDVFHHAINPSLAGDDLRRHVEYAAATWFQDDGPPKLHYSDQQPGKLPGAHSLALDLEAFLDFYGLIADLRVDVMLEVKDKEQSALKAMAALQGGGNIMEP